MALNLPETSILTKVGETVDSQQSPDDLASANNQLTDFYEESKRDAAFLRRAAEKEGRAYLMLKGQGFRVIFDQFILASFQKMVEEVVLPSYTRGQSVLEVFGSRIRQVSAEIDLIESSTKIQFSTDGLAGYVGQGVRTFVDMYDRYFRGSSAVKKDAIAILSVKGRRNFGYVTGLTFQRTSGNDYHVRASLNFWVPAEGEENVIGARLADQLIAEASTARLPASDRPAGEGAGEQVSIFDLPSREHYGSRYTEEGPEQNRSTLLVYDKDNNLILKFDNMYVTQIGDVDSEKVQFEVSSPSITKAWFYGRHLKALSVSAVLFDLEQIEGTTHPQGQLDLFEYLYDHYLRAAQVAHHRYRIEFFVRGHKYEGLISNYSLGLASDDDNIGAVSFTFMVLDEDPLSPNIPTVLNGDIDFGPATFSSDTVEELESQGELSIPEEPALEPRGQEDQAPFGSPSSVPERVRPGD